MNFKNIRDLSTDIKNWLPRLPHDIDLIAGIPRSGLLAANILALYMNKALTDIEGLKSGKFFKGGIRSPKPNLNKKLNILIIDDSFASGNAMKNVKASLSKVSSRYNLLYSAVYVKNFVNKSILNYQGYIFPCPRVFEWNIFHHNCLENSCMDIDGVLCRDPDRLENDDANNYKYFLTNVSPKILPTVKIGWIVSARLEKYRQETEAWLRKYNINFKKLILMNVKDQKTRIKLGNHAEFKANFYKNTPAIIFIESSKDQAIEIAKRTGKFVYCSEDSEMISPSGINKTIFELINKVKKTSFGRFYSKIKSNIRSTSI